MLTSGLVRLDLDGPAATITLNDPARRNALSETLLADLLPALGRCREDEGIRAVVLTGAGDRAFSAGADLQALASADSEAQLRRQLVPVAEAFTILSEIDKPVVGRINGHALAGGFGLALACDLLVSVDSALFGTPEVQVGLWPMLVQSLLARNLPRKVALEMMLLGERWTAADLHRLGLVNRVVARTDLDAEVARIVERLVSGPVEAQRRGMSAFHSLYDPGLRESLARMSEELVSLSRGDEARSGARAFLERQRPRSAGP